MAEQVARTTLRNFEFVKLLERYLPTILGATVIPEPRMGRYRPDFAALYPSGRQAIIEAQGVTPNTLNRLSQIVGQLQRYLEVFRKEYPRSGRPELVLAVPGTFSPRHMDYLRNSGIDRVIDGPALRSAGADPELGLAEAESVQSPDLIAKAHELLTELDRIQPGRAQWAAYQALCGDILSFLFCPPLSNPISEKLTRSKVNRRDFILPNYATKDFWEYMRNYYHAHYIVVDAKNYTGSVKKESVLQLANYLSAHGAGLFGAIVCRNGGDRSAEVTRREQWVLVRKLIIILNDNDLRQMISLRMSDSDSSDLLRQKIEDFRLGF